MPKTKHTPRKTSGNATDHEEKSRLDLAETDTSMMQRDCTNLDAILNGIASLGLTVQNLVDANARSQQDLQRLSESVAVMEADRRALPFSPLAASPTTNELSTASQNQQPTQEQQPASSMTTMAPSDSSIKLYDLPTFDGKPEEWPLFYANYIDSTRGFSYNNRQNLMRLQKALQGEARSKVSSLLIFPEDVPSAIEELEFSFGRPDLLVRCQLEKIDEFPNICEDRLQDVLLLANKVTNMVALFKSAKCEQHLVNPVLLQKLSEKLPPSKQYEWAKFAAEIRPFPSVCEFSDWIKKLARVVSTMPIPISSSSLTSPMRASRRVLLSCESTNDKLRKPTCVHCKKEHWIVNCPLFLALNVNDRWKIVKSKRLCFACLRIGHNLQTCRIKRKCGESGCQRMHNSLLHNEMISNQDTAHIVNCMQNRQPHLFFKIIPVILRGPKCSMATYAMLDDGSSVTLIEKDVANILGVKGPTTKLSLQWYDEAVKIENATKVSLEIKGYDQNSCVFSLKNVCTVSNLNLPKQSLNKQNYDHLKNLPLMNYCDATPSILIGLDNCHLGLSNEIVVNGLDQPVAVSTPLGWVAFGRPGTEITATLSKVMYIRESSTDKQIRQLVDDYFSIENFGVKNTDIILESGESKLARKILNETTKAIDGRYETGLLWKKKDIKLPESYGMACRRLLSVEKKMSEDSNYAIKYKTEMQKYLDKGFARKLTAEEIATNNEKVWYLPHFGVVNPNKPDKLRIVFDAAAESQGVSLNSQLSKGPDQAQPLIKILFKFRERKIAVAGDIQEMFCQVKIMKNDQHAQRYLWRDGNNKQPISIYQMTSMIFGAACSPCCAEFVKNVVMSDD